MKEITINVTELTTNPCYFKLLINIPSMTLYKHPIISFSHNVSVASFTSGLEISKNSTYLKKLIP